MLLVMEMVFFLIFPSSRQPGGGQIEGGITESQMAAHGCKMAQGSCRGCVSADSSCCAGRSWRPSWR